MPLVISRVPSKVASASSTARPRDVSCPVSPTTYVPASEAEVNADGILPAHQPGTEPIASVTVIEVDEACRRCHAVLDVAESKRKHGAPAIPAPSHARAVCRDRDQAAIIGAY